MRLLNNKNAFGLKLGCSFPLALNLCQVRDGISPLSPLVGVYCGSSIPAAITSSTNQLWVKFFSDSTDGESGFIATVRAVDTICGTHNIINVTAVNQVPCLKQ